MMKDNLVVSGGDWRNVYGDTDNLIVYRSIIDEYGIIVHDGGSSKITIGYCPRCGSKLPESKNEAYAEELERRGLELGRDELPKEMQTDEWWKILGL